jgi:hypothetical protein
MNHIQTEIDTRQALAAELSLSINDIRHTGQLMPAIPDWEGQAAFHLCFAAVYLLEAAAAIVKCSSSGYPLDKIANAQDYLTWASTAMQESGCFSEEELQRLK